MRRRKFSRKFKLEAVRLVRERELLLHRRPAFWMCTRMCCVDGFGRYRLIRFRSFPAVVR